MIPRFRTGPVALQPDDGTGARAEGLGRRFRTIPVTSGHARSTAPGQSGAALIVGLLLLMALTVIGASSMNTATLQLVMASNSQFREEAFQAAESGIETAIAQGVFNVESPTAVSATSPGDGSYSAETVVTFTQSTPVPDMAFSLGAGSFALQAFHFDVVAVGTAPRNAVSTHKQGFYVIGPGG